MSNPVLWQKEARREGKGRVLPSASSHTDTKGARIAQGQKIYLGLPKLTKSLIGVNERFNRITNNLHNALKRLWNLKRRLTKGLIGVNKRFNRSLKGCGSFQQRSNAAMSKGSTIHYFYGKNRGGKMETDKNTAAFGN